MKYHVAITVRGSDLNLTASVSIEIKDTDSGFSNRVAAIESAKHHFTRLGIGGLITNPSMRVSWDATVEDRLLSCTCGYSPSTWDDLDKHAETCEKRVL